MSKLYVVGIISGLISGMFTSGGGLILVPFFLYILKLKDSSARATSGLCILPMTIVSGLIYYNSRNINWEMGLRCALGGMLGGLIGATLLKKIPVVYFKLFFIVFLLYSSYRMLR